MKTLGLVVQFGGLNLLQPLIFLCAVACVGCIQKEKPMTLNELKELKFKVTVEGVNFDVPVLYHYNDAYLGTWPTPTDDELGGKRKKVDVLRFKALLPDLAPYNENNANEFEVLGHGKKVGIYVTKRRVNLDYYFNGAFKRLVQLPASQYVPNMYRYKDPMTYDQIYLSQNKPTDKLIKITCNDPELDPRPPVSASCEVQTVYQDRYDLTLTFALEYLPQWREIDQKAQQLLDSFIASANTITNQQGQ